MTGVGAQLCANPPAAMKNEVENEHRKQGRPLPTWGVRPCVLSDLSPIASFIAYNYNMPLNVARLEEAVDGFFKAIETELSWMYQTKHTEGVSSRINFTVWSEVFLCPECSREIKHYINEALDRSGQQSCVSSSHALTAGQLYRKDSFKKSKEQFAGNHYVNAPFSRQPTHPGLQ